MARSGPENSVKVSRLLEQLAHSRLISISRWVELQAQIPKSLKSSSEILGHLVELQVLTRFQQEKILAGAITSLRIANYDLLCPLGRGGMGVVYLARNSQLPESRTTESRLVALKLLPPKRAAEEPRTRLRFLREMQLRHQLPSHPFLTRLIAADEYHQVLYLAMEFIEGLTARQYVQTYGPMPIPLATRIIADVALGLQKAHEAGLIHRDIKPANIMVTPQERGKLLDYGFVLHRGESPPTDPKIIGGAGYTLGTTDYLAPEQARNAVAVSAETDLYSLGCSLYYLLTGRVPFQAATPMQKIRMHQNQEAPAIESLRPDAPEPVAKIVRYLMQKRPEDRPATAKVVADLLQPWALPKPAPTVQSQFGTAWEIRVIQTAEENWQSKYGTKKSPIIPKQNEVEIIDLIPDTPLGNAD